MLGDFLNNLKKKTIIIMNEFVWLGDPNKKKQGMKHGFTLTILITFVKINFYFK